MTMKRKYPAFERGAQNAGFPSNGSLELGLVDIFEKRTSILATVERRLDERVIFDSLKLANDGQTRLPVELVRAISPSVSCSSAPCGSGSMSQRHQQDSCKKESLCHRSRKIMTTPKYPECLEVPPGEQHILNPSMVFFPSSGTSPQSPQISQFSSSPSSGFRTPPVFFSPGKPLYFQQEHIHRQSLPAKLHSPFCTPPPSELSVSAFEYDHYFSQGTDSTTERMVSTTQSIEDEVFIEVENKPFDPKGEPDHDTSPLLQSQFNSVASVTIESTWPRRLIGRRRTIRQGGAIHNLPLLPPLPSLLKRGGTNKKTLPCLTPFTEHHGNVEISLLRRSPLKVKHKDCSLQDWEIFKEVEHVVSCLSSSKMNREEVVQEQKCQMETVKEVEEPGITDQQAEIGGEIGQENWEAVLQIVNSMWDEVWGDSESQFSDSLRQYWPLLNPPSGFGGSQTASCSNSLVGAEDLLDREILEKNDVNVQLNPLPYVKSAKPQQDNERIIMLEQMEQIPEQSLIPSVTSGAHTFIMEGKQVPITSDNEIGISHPSHTSQEDFSTDGDRTMTVLELGGVKCLKLLEDVDGDKSYNKDEHLTDSQVDEHYPAEVKLAIQILDTEAQGIFFNTEVLKNRNQTIELNHGTDSPQPLSPSKHLTPLMKTMLDSGDLDPSVATDSFVYLAVSDVAQAEQQNISTEVQIQSSNSKHCTNLDECDFLSTDSFVYLAAPDCHLMITETLSICTDSKDSDSEEGSESQVECAPSFTVEDSDWDSDLSESERDHPVWDHWDEMEQGVLSGLFCEDHWEAGMFHANIPQQQIAWQQSKLTLESSAAPKDSEQVASASEHAEGGETHTEVKSVH
ncbi:uncharacterized protein LOC114786093 isoform X2 [Denticeps clupeoides]|uniref:uncharacterized protein LOC114786093 isoform X2 n=1 Tax=Denticeps clupeoides TaxID=299321 RepID=UPI0010A3F361|nr:uncharacterized protein LOC114786093 isoform X2 [Denticeps clupeoides]